MPKITLFIWFLVCLILVGCSGAGGSGQKQPSQMHGYYKFNASAIQMTVGSTEEVSFFLFNSTMQTSAANFSIAKSGIIDFPDTCALDNGNPQTCNIQITALESGTAYIYDPFYPGQVLQVTVVTP